MNVNISVSGVDYDCPEGVQSIGIEDLYKVDFQLINIEDGFNPRHITKKGFDDENMKSLLDSIVNKGLLNPFICRWEVTDNGLQVNLVEGERRYHCINRLMESNENVWSREKNEFQPAREVFKAIPCRVVVATKDEALQYAASVQDCTVDWGEGAKTALVKKMRKEGYDDKRIISIFPNLQIGFVKKISFVIWMKKLGMLILI